MASREARKGKPAAARNFIHAMRGLFQWAVDNGLIDQNPTEGVSIPKQLSSGGFTAWTVDDVTAYETRWPAGTPQRVWLHVLLYTGLRRGDAVMIGKQHVRDEIATIRTEKNGIEVTIPIRPELQEILSTGPRVTSPGSAA